MKTFYKQNAKNTGMLSNWSFNSKEEAIFLKLVRQNGYDESTKKGKYSGGAQLTVKFTSTELFGLVAAFENRREFSFFHGFEDKKTNGSVKHSVYTKGDKQINYTALFVNRNEEKWNTNYTLDESDELADFLKFAASHINNALYSAEKKRVEEYTKKKEETKPPPKPEPKKEVEEVEELTL